MEVKTQLRSPFLDQIYLNCARPTLKRVINHVNVLNFPPDIPVFSVYIPH